MSSRTSADPIQQARRLVADLLVPRPMIYWADFVACLIIGYGAAALYLAADPFSTEQILSWLVAGVALVYALRSYYRRKTQQGAAPTAPHGPGLL